VLGAWWLYAIDWKFCAYLWLLRLCGVRRPDEPGYHERLRVNQSNVHDWLGCEYDDYLRELGLRVKIGFPQECPLELKKRWAFDPHPKKALRVSDYDDFVSSGGKIEHGVHRGKVPVVAKPCEILSKNKPRVIGNLGTRAASMGGFMMDYFKNPMSQEWDGGCVQARFVSSPDVGKLGEAFGWLMTVERGARAIYFSDDVCVSVLCQRADGTVVRLLGNADISACDGSHFKYFIDRVESFMAETVPSSWVPFVRVVFKQLRLDFKVVVGSQKVVGRTHGDPLLYSGSVLTTFLNNMAVMLSLVCYNRFLRELSRPPTEGEAASLLVASFERAGYDLKFEDVSSNPRLYQFLKHSPAFVDGKIVPYLNLGVFFRGFGMCDGDLPGKKKVPMKERIRRFNAGVVMSRVHAGEHDVSEAFRQAWPASPKDVVVNVSYQVTTNLSGVPKQWIPASELATRYEVPVAWVYHAAEGVRRAASGQYVDDPFVTRCLQVDYGITGRSPSTR